MQKTNLRQGSGRQACTQPGVRSCANSEGGCSASFEISDEDIALLEKISPVIAGKKYVPPSPTLCPDCREQRRAVQVNETHLYKRKCDKTGKDILSNFHPDAPFTIYEQEFWYSDQWDPLEYGQDFDFSRPFFEQYKELCEAVPHFNLFTAYQYDENCDFTNYAGKNKNCYLVFDTDESWDCYYSYSLNNCKNCVDCYRSRHCELCYEATDCTVCYNCTYIQDCDNCTDSMFLKNCIGCKNCLMCSNIRNKQYYVENKHVSQEEFEKYKSMLTSRPTLSIAAERFEKLKLEHPQKFIHGHQNEQVSGDYLLQCKNAYRCFDNENLWDCRYSYMGFMPLKDCLDVHQCGEGEMLYECSVSGYNALSMQFSANCLDQISNILYSTYCMHTNNVFGCCGLNRKQYCIFNKQYTKEQYEELAQKIIEHMQNTGEWGEFFPVTLSPFCYNESFAFDYYPLTKDEALERGWSWREKDAKEFQPSSIQLPDTSEEVDNGILNEVLACASSGKNYRIIQQELDFYRQMKIPLPTECFDVRHANRREKRNPWKLWARKCDKCNKEMQTSYSPERKESVYCEKCYLEEVC